ncbi:MAG: hypothetical protein ACRDIV_17890 [Ktedonobacteraceae bacterium]
MQRFIFQSAIVNRDGLYSYQGVSLEQAAAWLTEGPEPVFRLPLISSVAKILTGKEVVARPRERLFLHTGDEALILQFAFPEDQDVPGYNRGHVATQPRHLTLVDLRNSVRFGLLRKFARLDAYTRSVTQWDVAFGDRDGRRRYLVHDGLLSRFGVYEFGRIDLSQARDWFSEGRFECQLRYDGVCKALESLLDRTLSVYDSNTRASLSLHEGDQALVVYFHYPGGEHPLPLEPFTQQLDESYVRTHTQLNLLRRLSDHFVEANAATFPDATRMPRERRVG